VEKVKDSLGKVHELVINKVVEDGDTTYLEEMAKLLDFDS
jgi:hypothetical protein